MVWKVCTELVEIRNMKVRVEKIDELRKGMIKSHYAINDHMDKVLLQLASDTKYPEKSFLEVTEEDAGRTLAAQGGAAPAAPKSPELVVGDAPALKLEPAVVDTPASKPEPAVDDTPADLG